MENKNAYHYLSLIIPVYKQEKIIVKNLRQIKKALDKIRYPHEIITVVDGIVDQSLQKIKNAHIPGLKTIGYIKNQAVMLEFALVQYAMSTLIKQGFIPVIPPVLLKQSITDKLGYWQAGGKYSL